MPNSGAGLRPASQKGVNDAPRRSCACHAGVTGPVRDGLGTRLRRYGASAINRNQLMLLYAIAAEVVTQSFSQLEAGTIKPGLYRGRFQLQHSCSLVVR